MGLNLASILTESAGRVPDNVAVRLGDAELTYAELDERSARLATLLREKGIERGDRVGVMLPNVLEFPIAYYGVLRAGAVVVPMNVLLKRREIAFYLEDSGAKLLFAWHGFAEEAHDGAADAGAELVEVEPASFAEILAALEPTPGLAETEEDDTAVILYTSGTTGKPKGAELTHLNLFMNAHMVSHVFGSGPDDVTLAVLPMFHSFGQSSVMNVALHVGSTLTLVPRFETEKVLEVIQRDRVTVFPGVPTMFFALLHHPGADKFDTSSLRISVS
jgi:long-chain acyl-CoA synthetase